MAQRRKVKSNDTVDKLKLYGGIGAVGVAAGAAIAVSNDPMYDAEKKFRGKEVNRKAPWNKDLTKAMLDPLDADMYDHHVKTGNLLEAYNLESDARRNFHGKSHEQQQALLKVHEHAAAGFPTKQSFVGRMASKLRRARRL